MKLKYPWAPLQPRHEVAHLVDAYLGTSMSLLPQRVVRVSRAMRDLVRPYMYEEYAIEYADVDAAVKRARRWL